jgi:hypothetical protein
MEADVTSYEDIGRLRAELESVLMRHGLPIPEYAVPAEWSENSEPLFDLASRLLAGDLDVTKQGNGPIPSSAELASLLNHVLLVRESQRMRELQEQNPYFGVSTSRLIRDVPKP